MTKIIISDWDGTLFDSMKGIEENLVYTISNAFDTSEKDVINYFNENIGKPFSRIVMDYHEKTFNRKIDFNKVKNIERDFYTRLYKMDDYCSLFLDVMPFLEKMKEENTRVYISSGSRVDRVKRVAKPLIEHKLIIEALGFDSNKPEFSKGKGHYEEIKKLEKQKGNNNPEIIFLGDTIQDIKAAEQINAKPLIRIGTLTENKILKNNGIPFKTLKTIK